MARYLEDWERIWEHISPHGANSNGNGCFLALNSRRYDLTNGAAGGTKF